MGVKGGAKCAKYFLFFLNTVFFLTGAAILGIGLWLRFDKRINTYNAEGPLNTAVDLAAAVQTAYAIFIAFGAFIFVVGFCGCCGAIKESRCLLGFYIALIIAIMAGELGGGIYAYLKLKFIVDQIADGIEGDLVKNYQANTSFINDAFMTELKCCGWKGYQNFNFTFPKLPRPCCKNLTATEQCSTAKFPAVYDGCSEVFTEWLKHFGNVFIGVGVGIAALEIIVLIAGIALCCAIERY